MNTGQKLVELSGMSGVSALDHLLAITQGSGTGPTKTIFASQMTVNMSEPGIFIVAKAKAKAKAKADQQTRCGSKPTTSVSGGKRSLSAITHPNRVDVFFEHDSVFICQKTIRASVKTIARIAPVTSIHRR